MLIVSIIWSNFDHVISFPTQPPSSLNYCSVLTIDVLDSNVRQELNKLFLKYNDKCIKFNAIRCNFNEINSRLDVYDRCCRTFEFVQCLESRCSNSSSVRRLEIDKISECNEIGGEFKKCAIHQWFTYVVIFLVLLPVAIGITLPHIINNGKDGDFHKKPIKCRCRPMTFNNGRKNG